MKKNETDKKSNWPFWSFGELEDRKETCTSIKKNWTYGIARKINFGRDSNSRSSWLFWD